MLTCLYIAGNLFVTFPNGLVINPAQITTIDTANVMFADRAVPLPDNTAGASHFLEKMANCAFKAEAEIVANMELDQ